MLYIYHVVFPSFPERCAHSKGSSSALRQTAEITSFLAVGSHEVLPSRYPDVSTEELAR